MEKRKLGESEVREIRASQASVRYLAERFRVAPTTVLNIKHRRTYKEVLDYSNEPLLGPGLGTGTDSYMRMAAVDLLKLLPDGWCPTIVTSPPPRLSASSIRQYGAEEARRAYIDWQREVIHECIRVCGPQGVFLYHQMAEPEPSGRGGLDTKYDLVLGFTRYLRKSIIWDHGSSAEWQPGKSDYVTRTQEMPATYSTIYMFTGLDWSLPQDTWPAASAWGDIWSMEPIYVQGYRDRPRWVSFPDELADRCVALGEGTVLDPFAAAGAIPLAAVRAGRNWLACDTRPRFMAEFEERRAMAEAERWERQPVSS